jgi:hypothetical protein
MRPLSLLLAAARCNLLRFTESVRRFEGSATNQLLMLCQWWWNRAGIAAARITGPTNATRPRDIARLAGGGCSGGHEKQQLGKANSQTLVNRPRLPHTLPSTIPSASIQVHGRLGTELRRAPRAHHGTASPPRQTASRFTLAAADASRRCRCCSAPLIHQQPSFLRRGSQSHAPRPPCLYYSPLLLPLREPRAPLAADRPATFQAADPRTHTHRPPPSKSPEPAPQKPAISAPKSAPASISAREIQAQTNPPRTPPQAAPRPHSFINPSVPLLLPPPLPSPARRSE